MGLFNGRENRKWKWKVFNNTGVHSTHCILHVGYICSVSPDIPVTDLVTAHYNLSSLSSSHSRDVPTVYSFQIVVWDMKDSSLSMQVFCQQNLNANIHLPPTSVRITFSSLLQPTTEEVLIEISDKTIPRLVLPEIVYNVKKKLGCIFGEDRP